MHNLFLGVCWIVVPLISQTASDREYEREVDVSNSGLVLPSRGARHQLLASFISKQTAAATPTNASAIRFQKVVRVLL
ncbi:hypothetical protein C0Q70_00188 [Pomacea canaliculata]|uniref:Secreted protein n=1 Tax=Pomacea canaliculata TaxID=400727 RepID=A0A2T7PVZ2_POMCA|nr:hypothetical protein C0Q70_00188 [Pomacea canaliculata]